MLDAQRCAYIEVERLDQPDRRAGAALADIGNLWVDENYRREGIGSHLLRYASDLIAFLEHSGFEVATITQRGWIRAVDTA